jgi:hypothetical protein
LVVRPRVHSEGRGKPSRRERPISPREDNIILCTLAGTEGDVCGGACGRRRLTIWRQREPFASPLLLLQWLHGNPWDRVLWSRRIQPSSRRHHIPCKYAYGIYILKYILYNSGSPLVEPSAHETDVDAATWKAIPLCRALSGVRAYMRTCAWDLYIHQWSNKGSLRNTYNVVYTYVRVFAYVRINIFVYTIYIYTRLDPTINGTWVRMYEYMRGSNVKIIANSLYVRTTVTRYLRVRDRILGSRVFVHTYVYYVHGIEYTPHGFQRCNTQNLSPSPFFISISLSGMYGRSARDIFFFFFHRSN